MTEETTQATTPAPAALELTEQDKKVILESLNLLVKSADNALMAANQVLPLAAKISQSMEKK